MTDFLVTEKAMRPASKERRCFYCLEPVGGCHKSDCVLVSKRVMVRMVVEYEVEVPSDWDKEAIEFHRNDSSWCANNALDELGKLYGEEEEATCMCWCTKFDYLRDTSESYLSES